MRGVLTRLSAYCLAVSLLIVARGDAVVGDQPAITETVFSAPVLDIRWLSWITKTNQVLLLLTQDGQLYRSIDGGKGWTGITRQIGGSNFQVIQILNSPADKNVVVVIGPRHEHFASTDAGGTWQEMKLPAGRTRAFWFHDSRPQWALFSTWTHGCNWVKGALIEGEVDDAAKLPCNHALYATRDLGRTFSRIASHVVQFDWGDAPHADRIYFTHFKDKDSAQPRFDHWMAAVDFSYTDWKDEWKQITNVIDGGNKFVISHGYILVATVQNKELGLMVSQDAGAHFKKVVMPRHLKESSYVVLDTSEDAVVIHVNHGHGIGHIYVSDLAGVRYTLSLANNVRGRGNCAFERVMNLRGIYLANVRDPSPSDFAPAPGAKVPKGDDLLGGLSSRTQADKAMRGRRLTKGDDLLGSLSSRTQADKAMGGRRLMKQRFDQSLMNDTARRLDAANKNARTVISFDRGGAWTYLRPPEKDSLGDPIYCPPDSCWLHMHDITEFDKFVPFYSYTNAVGIIMGTGNIGPYLTDDLLSTNTYLSRDGGLTWVEAHKGNFIYEFGNHGGLLMMADWAREARLAYYSSDQGYSWKSIAFSPQPMNVSNILTEQKAMSTKFILFGIRGQKGVLYHVDFDRVGARMCKGLSKRDSPESDYESWTPSDGKSDERCLLGRQSLYTRRKQLAGCTNNKDLPWPIVKRNCTCTAEDFECDAGFTRKVDEMVCLPEHQTDFFKDENGNPGVCANAKTGTVEVDAYRKVSGDTCIGGWQPLKFKLPCDVLKIEAEASEIRAELHEAEHGQNKAGWFSWTLFAQALAALIGLAVAGCLCTSTRMQNWLIGIRIKLSGQRDYSSTAKDPPSAVNDPTNIGVSTPAGYNPPAKIEEMKSMP